MPLSGNGITTSPYYYADMDHDGYGNPNIYATGQIPGWVTNNLDCNDNDPDEHPGQIWYRDEDGDGYSDGTSMVSCSRPAGFYLATELTATSGDNYDNDDTVYPGAPEINDGKDNDQDGDIDEDDDGLPKYPYYYQGGTGWCGLYSTKMLLAGYGIKVQPWEIASEFDKDLDDGINSWEFLWSLKDYLKEQLGCEVQAGNFSAFREPIWCDKCSEFKNFVLSRTEINLPVIVLSQNINHVFLILWADRNYVYVHDPSGAFTEYTEEYVDGNPLRVSIKIEWDEFFDITFSPYNPVEIINALSPDEPPAKNDELSLLTLSVDSHVFSSKDNTSTYSGIVFKNSYMSEIKHQLQLQFDGHGKTELGYRYVPVGSDGKILNESEDEIIYYPPTEVASLAYSATLADNLSITAILANADNLDKNNAFLRVGLYSLNSDGSLNDDNPKIFFINRKPERGYSEYKSSPFGFLGVALSKGLDISPKDGEVDNPGGRYKIVLEHGDKDNNNHLEVASFQLHVVDSEYAEISIYNTPENLSCFPGESFLMPIWISNTGTQEDSIEFIRSKHAMLEDSYSFYEDADDNNIPDGEALIDTDGDDWVNLGSFLKGTSKKFLLESSCKSSAHTTDAFLPLEIVARSEVDHSKIERHGTSLTLSDIPQQNQTFCFSTLPEGLNVSDLSLPEGSQLSVAGEVSIYKYDNVQGLLLGSSSRLAPRSAEPGTEAGQIKISFSETADYAWVTVADFDGSTSFAAFDQFDREIKSVCADGATPATYTIRADGEIDYIIISSSSGWLRFYGYSYPLAEEPPPVAYVCPDGNCNGMTPCFQSLDEAVTATGENLEIRLREGAHAGPLTLAASRRLSISGGWKADFSAVDSVSIIPGGLVVSSGSMIISGLALGPAAGSESIDFRVSSGLYPETIDLEQAVANEFGPDYRIADWNDIVAYYNAGGSPETFREVCGQSAMLTRNGEHFWSSYRHYFYDMSDRPGQTPFDSYLSHANIDNHIWDLGSWYGLSKKILVRKIED